ncbi:MAG: flagellar export protein FliJ [Thermoleophilaceae bacterium]|nr:flagellar export protein FliJ [Thermoleophilaceae bacterium]
MDRPFKFSLERVRALRERTEELAREQLAASLSHRSQGEARLRAASATVERARRRRRELAGAAVTAGELVARQMYLERTEREREAAALDLDRRDAEVQARRRALASAARERQVLERLEERRRADHELRVARRECAALDEMALSIHCRRGHSS